MGQESGHEHWVDAKKVYLVLMAVIFLRAAVEAVLGICIGSGVISEESVLSSISLNMSDAEIVQTNASTRYFCAVIDVVLGLLVMRLRQPKPNTTPVRIFCSVLIMLYIVFALTSGVSGSLSGLSWSLQSLCFYLVVVQLVWVIEHPE